MKAKDLLKLGFPEGRLIGLTLRAVGQFGPDVSKTSIKNELTNLLLDPESFKDHPILGEVAKQVIGGAAEPVFVERAEPAPYQIWGEGLEQGALDQMAHSVRLPVAVRGALMPDAHQGYGLPIGGVLATENAVIPYAVGVDIACRMKLSVFDVPAKEMARLEDQLERTLLRETLFGAGKAFKKPEHHDVLDDPTWKELPTVQRLFPKAREQLGTSGSGNHFVEFGTLTLDAPDLGLQPGSYLAVLSHSGSRGAGAQVAEHYSRLAMSLHPELPPELKRLAWLSLDHEGGQEYMRAMNLMGEYAKGNHAVIHRKIAKALGFKVLAGVENHHNFCIPATERVPTPDGPVSIAELTAGDEVYSFDPQRGLVRSRVKAAWSNGPKPIYTIRTTHRRIRVSGGHPILVTDGDGSRWVKAEELRPGDPIVCGDGYYRADRPIPVGHARLIGAFLGDGWVRADTARRGYSFGLAIGTAEDPHTRRYVELMESVALPEVEKGTWKNAALRLKVCAPGAYGISGSNKRFHSFVSELGIAVESKKRRVPATVFTAPVADKLEFLAGYMDADGSIGNAATRDGSGLIRACGEHLVRDLREIAIAAGLPCTNLRRKRLLTNFGETDCFMFNISPCGMKRLDLWHARKRAIVESANARPDRRAGELPDGLFAEKVKTITISAEEEVFDIEVDHPTHCFVCEGVVVHNCWREVHDGKDLYVHRKGATPAGKGVLGVIPGSMATPGFVVRGRGNEASLLSASHGAGRVMSRTAAKAQFRWSHIKPMLEERGIKLLSAGIDENPFVYKDIHQVMKSQADLVDVVARFDPKIVRMAGDGERPED